MALDKKLFETVRAKAKPGANTFELIFSYVKRPQEFGYVNVRGDIKERAFVKTLLRYAEFPNDLNKISTCKMNEGKYPAYLCPRNGKYYFNPEVNDDADVRRWKAFRDKCHKAAIQDAIDYATAKAALIKNEEVSAKAMAVVKDIAPKLFGDDVATSGVAQDMILAALSDVKVTQDGEVVEVKTAQLG